MRILVTGITGFAGGHLTEALSFEADLQIFGLSRTGRWTQPWNHLTGRAVLLECDLSNNAAVEGVLRYVRPQQIYHLAGYAHVGRSFGDVDAAWEGNLTASRSLYDAIVRLGEAPRILYVGSGMSYGDPEKAGEALSERCPL